MCEPTKARTRPGDAARGLRAVVLRCRAALVVAILVAGGCGEVEPDATLDRVRSDLREAERRLDEASRQAEASAREAQLLARQLGAARQELADARSTAANELRRLGRHVVAVEGELRAMRESDDVGGRDDRDRADRLSPVGAWARAGAPHRFLFLENGRGLFQTWDVARSRWRDGKWTVGTMTASSGHFAYELAGEEGVYLMRYTEQRKRTPPRAEPSAAGPAAVEPAGAARALEVTDETRVVELLFIMRSHDDARLVGWSDDPVVGRVDEQWTPEISVEEAVIGRARTVAVQPE